VGVAPLPRGSAGRASCLGGWQLAMSAYSRHKDEAWKFIEFMTGPVAQKSMAIALSTVPTRKGTFQDPEVVKKAPEFPAMLQVVLTARPRPQVAEYPRLSDIVQTNLSAALAGQTTSDDAVTRMARDIRGLLKQ
jgi:multiple sugar transport system substrate-binding protein